MAIITALQSLHPDWVETAERLGPVFAERAAAHDRDGSFAAENFADLRAARLLSAGVPAAFGGGGASYVELATILRRMARHCGGTALAYAMHTHQVVIAAWRQQHQGAPTDALLRRVANEELMLASTGGNDWLAAGGTATAVDGGFRISARKTFVSGAPAADLVMTSAVLEGAGGAPSVLHFGVPMAAEGVRIEPTWDTLGMRASGSHDVVLDGVFVADAAIGGRRAQGLWHPLFHIISLLAFPLVYSVYVGLADAARDRAVASAQRPGRRHDVLAHQQVGEMENQHALATLALESMIATAVSTEPGPAATNAIHIRRALAGRAAVATVEKAMEVIGGGAYFRRAGVERLFRDVQGARFHPLADKEQLAYAGRIAVGLGPDPIAG
ncbi:MAG: acyl-CoA dehydrogenase family protein [Rhodospirillales bacterium]